MKIKEFWKEIETRIEFLQEKVKQNANNPYWIGRLHEAERIYEEYIKKFNLPF